MEFQSPGEILDFAVKEEEKAAAFYKELAEKVENPGVRETLLSFAREEEGHKARLLEVKEGKLALPEGGKVADLKISDYTVDVEPSPGMTYTQALVAAMKAEKAAFRLYSDLAASAEDPALKEMFLGLAQEEAKHKLRFEIEYDEQVMTDN